MKFHFSIQLHAAARRMVEASSAAHDNRVEKREWKTYEFEKFPIVWKTSLRAETFKHQFNARVE